MPLTPRLTGDPLTDYHILKMHTGYDHHPARHLPDTAPRPPHSHRA